MIYREHLLSAASFSKLARQPRAANLIALNIASTGIKALSLRANIGKFKNLISLDVSGNSIGDTGLAVLAEQSFAPNLTLLGIAHIRPPARWAYQVVALKGTKTNMAKFTSLISLDFSGNHAGDAELAELAQQPFARNIRQLKIRSNNITHNGIKISMGAFESLDSLDVSGNLIGDTGLVELAVKSFAPNLTSLTIDSIGITPRGIVSLNAFKGLSNLSISHNRIVDVGLEQLAQLPCAHNLFRLAIEDVGITAAGIASMSNFRNLTRLYAGNNFITNIGLKELARQPFAGSLMWLDISKTHINDVGIEAMVLFKNLTGLNIAENPIGDRGIIALALLPFAQNLTWLNIMRTGITATGIASMAAFRSLTTLDISYNTLKIEGLERLGSLYFAPRLVLRAHMVAGVSYPQDTLEWIKNNENKFKALLDVYRPQFVDSSCQ